MKRLHVSIAVRDLNKSVRFYSTLFGINPSVLKTDYAKWMLEDPRVNFSISTRNPRKGIDHLGIQVENEFELATLAERLTQSGQSVREEKATICCYTKSNKAWVCDPEGVTWETFHTFGESADYSRDHAKGEPRQSNSSTCCNPTVGQAKAPSHKDAYNVLFLCTGNSARSIMAEALLNHWGQGHYRGFSAGSDPKGSVHPFAIELLRRMKLPVDNLRSKCWDEFAKPTAPVMDFVLTICDQAAGEVCPAWPGQPITAHWGFSDPAAFDGDEAEKRVVFADVFRQIENRIKTFCALPIERLSRLAIHNEFKRMGQQQPETAASIYRIA